MTSRLSSDYWNDPHSQELRREVLKNDRDCMMSRAQNDADLLNSGRFAKKVATQVTGASGSPTYPQQQSGPWSAGDSGAPDANMDQLGYSVNDQEPCGSVQEIEKSLSLADAADPSGSDFSSAGDRGEGQGRSANRPIDNAAPSHSRSATPSSSPETVDQGRGRRVITSPQPRSRKAFRRF